MSIKKVLISIFVMPLIVVACMNRAPKVKDALPEEAPVSFYDEIQLAIARHIESVKEQNEYTYADSLLIAFVCFENRPEGLRLLICHGAINADPESFIGYYSAKNTLIGYKWIKGTKGHGVDTLLQEHLCQSLSQYERLFWTQYYTGENVCRWPVSVYAVDSLPKIHYLYQKATRSSIGIDYLH